MSRKFLIFLCIATTLTGIKLKDPRTMEFPARLDFTPHQVDRFTLSNGIQVFFVEDHQLPVTDIYFSVTAGENRISADHAGLAKILANLVVKGGSNQVLKDVFEDSLDRFGASFSGSAGNEQATFKLHLLSEHVPALLSLVVGAIRDPALPQNQLELNKRQYLTSYQGRNDDPRSVAPRVFYKLIYGKESSQAREVTPASLENVTLEQLREFHLANYRPGHIMIGVEGDFDSKAMLDLLERCMGDWQIPQVEPWPESANYTDPAPPGVYLVHWPGSVQSNIRMGYASLVRSDPCYPESRILAEVYGGAWFSRLRHRVRDERGLAYVVSGHINTNFEEPGVFRGVCLTKSETTIQAAKLMLEIISDLKTEGITQRELGLAKQSWLASFPSHYEDPEEVLRDRMDYAAHGYPIDFWDRLPDKIEPLTCEDVGKFTAEFLKPEDLIILILGDTTAMDGSVSELGKVQIIDSETY